MRRFGEMFANLASAIIKTAAATPPALFGRFRAGEREDFQEFPVNCAKCWRASEKYSFREERALCAVIIVREPAPVAVAAPEQCAFSGSAYYGVVAQWCMR